MINNAIAQSAQPIISYNYGCGKTARVNRAIRLSIGTALLCGLAVTILTWLFSKPLVGAFLKPDCNAYRIAVEGIPLFAMGFVFFAFNIASIGYYQSIEKARRATIFTLLRGFFFMIICFLTLPYLLGVKGIWLSIPCSELLTALVITGVYFFDPKTFHKSKFSI